MDFNTLVENIIRQLGEPIIIFIFALAFIGFLWWMFIMIVKSSSGEDLKEAKQRMVWSIIILLIMFSIWGILNILEGTLDLNKNEIHTYPNFQI